MRSKKGRIIEFLKGNYINPRNSLVLFSFIAILIAGFLYTKLKILEEKYTPSAQITKVLSTPTPTESPTPQPTPIFYTPVPTQANVGDWGKTIKLDDKTSASRFAPDDHMSTVGELNQAMNQYRQNHGLPTLNFDSLLCNIAQTRANQNLAFGKLDSHAGFSALAHNQQTYNMMDEVLFGGVQPVAGVHIVEWGWDQSLTGHHDTISDPIFHDGCAGIAGYFAVFEFGAR